jgi:hypothetical protein
MTKRKTVNSRVQFPDFPDRSRGGLAPEDERELTMRTVGALAAFGAPVEIVVKDEIAMRGARIDVGDDHSLALLEFQGGRGKRIDAYLAPDSDLDVEAGQRRHLRTRLRLYSIVEKPLPTTSRSFRTWRPALGSSPRWRRSSALSSRSSMRSRSAR